MNKEPNEGLDNLFKKKLDDPVDQAGFREEDWGSLEKMLDKHKKPRGIVYWLPLLSGVAALLLLFCGWWLFRGKETGNNSKGKPAVAAIHHQHANTGQNGGPARQQAPDTQNKKPLPVNYAKNVDHGINNSTGNSLFKRSADGARRTAGSVKTATADTLAGRSDEMLAVNTPLPAFESEQMRMPAPQVVDLSARSKRANAVSIADKKSMAKVTVQKSFHPQFAVTVLAAPDINGVGSFQQSKVGSNFGVQLSASISKKFTLTTGVVYSSKPYITPFENYHTPHQFSTDPVNVSADCKMLDIPLNLGYQLYNKHQSKISIGTGLSSYFMLHESYKFNYANSYVAGPSNYTVPNSNNYYFGVLNLNATYQRQITQKVSIAVQPYFKLPLTNIGYSQVRLQTTGVALGLSWNLNSVGRP